ncbi:hypothetical protein K1T71_009631 [Dendrolimus kikuchii]|uniref:Uncharacterized protein n=1 Tax=Dendrolimus kikuchii TaxID=765133 RepID=A0ACC1CSH3_9NEOP|nr:hypothetical protein K1T71_009631 [Dendrolimus kikuchii]
MGKKNKNTLKNSEEVVMSNSNSKNKRKAHDNMDALNQNIKEGSAPQTVKKIKTNMKGSDNNEGCYVIHDNHETVTESTIKDNNIVAETKTTKSKKNKGAQKALNKKMIFNDDKIEDTNFVEQTNSNTNLKFLQGEEAEVKEEDIDKFCDEISEEDNVQYENWVKLFEAQFTSCKNNKKCNKTNKT